MSARRSAIAGCSFRACRTLLTASSTSTIAATRRPHSARRHTAHDPSTAQTRPMIDDRPGRERKERQKEGTSHIDTCPSSAAAAQTSAAPTPYSARLAQITDHEHDQIQRQRRLGPRIRPLALQGP
eukprot:1852310-Prymnesium_polylepis.1